MNDQTQVAGDEAAETVKTVIRPDLNRYVRDKSGKGKRTHRTDDFVARTLAGKDLDTIKQGAPLLGVDCEKWAHLNPGQQRMLIGNAIRHLMADAKNPLLQQSVTDVYGDPCEPYDASKAQAAAEPAAEAPVDPEPVAEEPKKAKKQVSKK